VFQLILEGHRNAAIAELLSISPRTAETHRANLIGMGQLAHAHCPRPLPHDTAIHFMIKTMFV